MICYGLGGTRPLKFATAAGIAALALVTYWWKLRQRVNPNLR